MKIRYTINQEAVEKIQEDCRRLEERQKFFHVYGYIFDDPEIQDEQLKEGYE